MSSYVNTHAHIFTQVMYQKLKVQTAQMREKVFNNPHNEDNYSVYQNA